MIFETITEFQSAAGPLYRVIEHLMSLGTLESLAMSKIDLDVAMVSMALGESLTLESDTGNEVKIVRVI